MVTCPSCRAEQNETSSHCSECGAALDHKYAATVTQDAVDAQPEGESSTTGSHDSHHGRFIPGATVAHRYRIVSMVGRGGMGEVYRADDLKLGQTVALKFLPKDLGSDPRRQEYFHREVRLTRQISHPNVCRVYDIGEFQGQQFLSMEYIDGEDLSSLIRRIGRLPPAKSLQITQQLCAGLAAAHDRGVLHRDLKPANVMIDGRGHARITDFGLARMAGDVPVGEIAGTPAYMAPEQRLRGEATIQSDLFALGLILVELHTGEHVYESRSNHDVTNALSQSIAWGEDVDPTVQRVINLCLEPDPHDRPASAREVAARLPGGDPLAAALEAGETPSPEMIAASGNRGQLSLLTASICLALVLGGLFLLTLYLGDRSPTKELKQQTCCYEYEFTRLWNDFDLTVDDGLESEEDREFTALGFEAIKQQNASRKLDERKRWDVWFRRSPKPLVPLLRPHDHRGRQAPGINNPPPSLPGMVSLRMRPNGALRELLVVENGEKQAGQTRNWNGESWRNDDQVRKLWEAAIRDSAIPDPGIEPVRDPVRVWTPQGPDYQMLRLKPDQEGEKSSIESVTIAAHNGRIVFFHVIDAEDEEQSRYESHTDRPVTIGDWSSGQIVAFFSTLLAMLLAWRNLLAGRSDLKGALRLAVLVFFVRFGESLFGSPWTPSLQLYGLYTAIRAASRLWIFYVALEPLARRYWPEMLVTWSRALTGRVQDPGIGRDLLLGMTFGIVYCVIVYALLSVPTGEDPHVLLGLMQSISQFGFVIGFSLGYSLFWAVVMVLVRAVAGNMWLPVIVVICLSFVWHMEKFYPLLELFVGDQSADQGTHIEGWWALWDAGSGSRAQDMLGTIGYYGVVALILARWGVLASASFMLCWSLVFRYPWSNDLVGPDVPGFVFAVAMIVVATLFGSYTSVGGKAAFVAKTSMRE